MSDRSGRNGIVSTAPTPAMITEPFVGGRSTVPATKPLGSLSTGIYRTTSSTAATIIGRIVTSALSQVSRIFPWWPLISFGSSRTKACRSPLWKAHPKANSRIDAIRISSRYSMPVIRSPPPKRLIIRRTVNPSVSPAMLIRAITMQAISGAAQSSSITRRFIP